MGRSMLEKGRVVGITWLMTILDQEWAINHLVVATKQLAALPTLVMPRIQKIEVVVRLPVLQ